MAAKKVLTLTLNPSIDVSSEAERVEPEKKIRTCCERIDPGGGGINVARVLQRLSTSSRQAPGLDVEAVFLAGGATGAAFDELVAREGLVRRWVRIADDTRTSLTVHERSGGREFRFVPEGPTITAEELAQCRAAVVAASCDWLVASGSLPPGVPDDFYAEIGGAARDRGARLILDTSGAALDAALAAGGISVLKVSKEEMSRDSAAAVVARGEAAHVALTLGSDGALLIGADATLFLPAFEVETVSTVGAGDSFLAGLTYGLAQGMAPAEAFRIAVAAGAAATLEPGTDVAYPEKTLRLLERVPQPERLG
ncbi:1-phosphofructokinase family hexose kinase [Sphingomonas lutea]|nr:hexose kinase [Sphingomonas lutea]